MRVVAGDAKGRPLVAPKGEATRPTSDRVREATFSTLGSLLGLDWAAGARVLDLFAGSGALGIEALSRGAAHATFVDHSRPAADAVRRNLASCGYADAAAVVVADALRWLAGRPLDEPWDVVFCDPPYAFSGWSDLLDSLSARADTVVLESDREVDVPPEWHVLRVRRHGTTVVLVARSPQARA